mmetsp:Transcript_42648/g.104105  ORF Transcript_42648/g.104105 Transcript_42648/m.104105 type:complete len:351 (-) Transcript_42648:160-1212(-)
MTSQANLSTPVDGRMGGMAIWHGRAAILVALIFLTTPSSSAGENCPEATRIGQGNTPWQPVLDSVSLAMQLHRTAPIPPDKFFRRPFVTVTYAQALDGSIADQASRPLPLSSPDAFNMTHHLRALHKSILVGVQTLINDDPSLTVRLCQGQNPQTVVLDTSLRTPLNSRLASSPSCVRPIVATAPPPRPSRHAGKARGLEELGCSVMPCAVDSAGRISWASLLQGLSERGVENVMVEGGARVISSLVEQGYADYAIVTVSPMYIGGLRCYGQSFQSFKFRPRPAWRRLLGWVRGRVGAFVGWLAGKGGGSSREAPVEATERSFPKILDAQIANVGGDVVVFGHLGRMALM